MIVTQEQKKNWLNQKFDEPRQRFGGECARCGSQYDLQFAHVHDTGLTGSGRGKFKRYYNIINNLFSYILLCSYCHRQYDNERKTNNEMD